MRMPDFDLDGWCLDDGEERHREAPDTFSLPERDARDNLQRGDLVKLIFRISVDVPDEPVAVERMWVLVRERVANGYLGLLDNNPASIAENEEFWSGIELAFQPQHIIDIKARDSDTTRLAGLEPRRRWIF